MTGRWRSRSTTRVSRQGPVKPSMWSRCAGFVLRTGFCRPRSRRSLLGNSRSLTSRHDSGSRRVPCIIGSLKASSRLGAGACRSPRTLRRRIVNGCSLRCTSNSQPKRALWEVQFEVTVPALEDKIVQKATVTVLNAIYEQDFLSCSYGFRPGLSPHDALDAIRRTICYGATAYVLEADIQSYFDRIVRSELMAFVERRIGDSSILQLIRKWIHVGIIEDGRLLVTETGTGQGQVISPLLANIYLHYVLDEWFEHEVKPRLRGMAAEIRYADDFILCFQHREDAERVLNVLSKRFARYGLTLHPEKTRLLAFGRSARPSGPDAPKPATFDFLGFTHVCARSRRGRVTIHVRTMRTRLRRRVKAVGPWGHDHRHDPVEHQAAALNAKLRGHYQYYGRPTNYRCLQRFYRLVRRLWPRWLNRRTRGKTLDWARYQRLLQRHPLLLPRICHAWASTGSPA